MWYKVKHNAVNCTAKKGETGMNKGFFECTFCGSLRQASTARDHGQALTTFHFDRHHTDDGMVCRGSGTEVLAHSIEQANQCRSGHMIGRRECGHYRR
jgi:hypothetical protein